MIKDVQPLLRRQPRPARHHHGHRGPAGHRLHRALRLRQVHAAALPQPDERPHRQREDHGHHQGQGPRHQRAPPPTSSRCGAGSGWCSRSRTPSPSRSTRTWSTACASPGSTTRRPSTRPASARLQGRRPLGRGEGPAAGERPRASPAARCSACASPAPSRWSPRSLLMDEPCSALDPIATLKIEELIYSLKEKYTIVIVTHNLQQAARVSDRTAFFWLGRLVEYGAHPGHVHEAAGEADRGLHHGPVRLERPQEKDRHGTTSFRRRAAGAQEPPARAWARWSRSACTAPCTRSSSARPRRPRSSSPATRRSTTCRSRSTTAA